MGCFGKGYTLMIVLKNGAIGIAWIGTEMGGTVKATFIR